MYCQNYYHSSFTKLMYHRRLFIKKNLKKMAHKNQMSKIQANNLDKKKEINVKSNSMKMNRR